MLTAGQLIEFLSSVSPDTRVTTEQGEDIIHLNMDEERVTISPQKPIAYCNRTGCYVYPTISKGYYGYSIELDEDVYSFETTPLNPDKSTECD